MIELRILLQEYLKTLHSRVYFQTVNEKEMFPYIIYDFPNSIPDGEGYELITVDIDGWDYNNTGDTTEIENLMRIINSLDKKTLISDDTAVTFYLENKIPLVDPDKRIKRRKYIYQAKLFRRDY